MALAEAALSNAEIPLRVRDRLGEIRGQAVWLSELLLQLIEPPATGTAEGESNDLVELASEVVELEMVTYPGDLSLQWSGGNMHVAGNGVEPRRAIVNLLSNATRAAGPSGKVLVQLHRAAEHVLLTVHDSGPGFGLIHRDVGLGLLAVIHGLKSYGGSLEYSRSQMGGVRAILALRAFDAAVLGKTGSTRGGMGKRGETADCLGGMMRLVLCDDQRILIESLAVALQARGHDVLAAVTTPGECVQPSPSSTLTCACWTSTCQGERTGCMWRRSSAGVILIRWF